MIRANCRSQLTPRDFAFVIAATGQNADDEAVLGRIVTDEMTRDALLDDERVLLAVLNLTEPLPISLYLYFYVLTRRVLTQRDITDRDVADYVSSLLVEFSRSQRAQWKSDAAREEYHYVTDLIGAAERASSEKVFLIHSELGSYLLFITGIFPEHVRYRVWRRGAPGLSFYEGIGSSSYRLAAGHALAHRHALKDIYAFMAERFSDVRLSLNRLSDSLLHLEGLVRVENLLGDGGQGGAI